MPTEADVLLNHCLLQEAPQGGVGVGVGFGGGGYRLHDLVLEYLALIVQMRRDGRRFVEEACARQASFLSSPGVLRAFSVGGEGTTAGGGLYSLVAAWNSLTKLLADSGSGSAALNAAQYYKDSLNLGDNNNDNGLRQEAGELLMLLVG